jgi:hypothetical protein
MKTLSSGYSQSSLHDLRNQGTTGHVFTKYTIPISAHASLHTYRRWSIGKYEHEQCLEHDIIRSTRNGKFS